VLNDEKVIPNQYRRAVPSNRGSEFGSLNHAPASDHNTSRIRQPYRPRMSAMRGIVLQKSPSGLCEIEICNYRIGAPVLLNRCCAFQPDLESIFLAEMLKILLQHNPRQTGRDIHVESYRPLDPTRTSD
jgi:hypothetical protein